MKLKSIILFGIIVCLIACDKEDPIDPTNPTLEIDCDDTSEEFNVSDVLDMSNVYTSAVYEGNKRAYATDFEINLTMAGVEAEVCNPENLSIKTAVEQPYNGQIDYFDVPIKEGSLIIEDGVLKGRVEGPLYDGSVFDFKAKTFGLNDGVHEMRNSKGEATVDGIGVTPREASDWFKKAPSNIELFSKMYNPNAGSANDVAQPQDNMGVANILISYFDEVDDTNNGEKQLITVAEKDKLMDLFYSPNKLINEVYLEATHDKTLAELFPAPNGSSDAMDNNLAAAVFATRGTVRDAFVEMVLGINENNTPFVFERVPNGSMGGAFAQVFVTGDQYTVKVIEHFPANIPPHHMAWLIGHEGVHGPNRDGLLGDVYQDEEVIGAISGAYLYLDQLAAFPKMALEQSSAVEVKNSRALAVLNSGQDGFPGALGVKQNPGPRQEILPEYDDSNNSLTPLEQSSFENYVRERRYPDEADLPSVGNNVLDRFVSAVTGDDHSGLDFDDATISLLDAMSFMTKEQRYKIEETLNLKVVPNN